MDARDVLIGKEGMKRLADLPQGARVGTSSVRRKAFLKAFRPDLQIVLIEPLARRVDWLDEVISDLGLDIAVERGRAEEPAVLRRWEGADVVTARAVGPLARLAGLCLPLLRPGGAMLVLKGASAPDEIARDATAVRALGGGTARIHEVGAGVVDPLTTVVEIPRIGAPRPKRRKERR